LRKIRSISLPLIGIRKTPSLVMTIPTIVGKVNLKSRALFWQYFASRLKVHSVQIDQVKELADPQAIMQSVSYWQRFISRRLISHFTEIAKQQNRVGGQQLTLQRCVWAMTCCLDLGPAQPLSGVHYAQPLSGIRHLLTIPAGEIQGSIFKIPHRSFKKLLTLSWTRTTDVRKFSIRPCL
jgi:hypothetical protein